MIDASFKSILVPENNGKQNPDEYYTYKHQNHIGCGFSYKLVCVVDHFNKPFNSCLAHDSVHKFITYMVKKVNIPVS